MACDVASLHAAAADLTASGRLTNGQVAMVRDVQHLLGGPPVSIPATLSEQDRLELADSITAMAGTVAARQRDLLASTVVNGLRANDWTVLVVEGGAPDRYTGIEASRGAERLIAAVGPGELIADHATASGSTTTTASTLTTGLQEAGLAIVVTDEAPREGPSGTLFTLPGGPTPAHAVQSCLRHRLRPQP
jgi:hypothetical protein